MNGTAILAISFLVMAGLALYLPHHSIDGVIGVQQGVLLIMSLLCWYFSHFRPKFQEVINDNLKLQEAFWGHLERIEKLENIIVQKNEKKPLFWGTDLKNLQKSNISLLKDVECHSESIHQFGCEIDDIYERIDMLTNEKDALVNEVVSLTKLIKKAQI